VATLAERTFEVSYTWLCPLTVVYDPDQEVVSGYSLATGELGEPAVLGFSGEADIENDPPDLSAYGQPAPKPGEKVRRTIVTGIGYDVKGLSPEKIRKLVASDTRLEAFELAESIRAQTLEPFAYPDVVLGPEPARGQIEARIGMKVTATVSLAERRITSIKAEQVDFSTGIEHFRIIDADGASKEVGWSSEGQRAKPGAALEPGEPALLRRADEVVEGFLWKEQLFEPLPGFKPALEDEFPFLRHHPSRADGPQLGS